MSEHHRTPPPGDDDDEPIGIIGGTGLGDSLSKRVIDGNHVVVDTPFGKPSDSILVGKLGGGDRKIAFINRHGPGHFLPPSKIPFAANIFALKKLGVRTIISMGAVGSLAEQIAPGDLVVVDQFIDKTFKRENTFFADYGAIHVEMAEPTCTRLCDKIIDTGNNNNNNNNNNNKVNDDDAGHHTIHPRGTYVCMEGPSFSTRAESLMHKAWGGDMIGMTAMPEARLAREAQMCYSLIALVSDYDCWHPHEPNTDDGSDKKVLLKEIIANMQTACKNCIDLIEAVLSSDHVLNGKDCICRKSLELAVWTDQEVIKEDQKEKLKVLFE
jgi:5'-methylthioadenosine phosphorylase